MPEFKNLTGRRFGKWMVLGSTQKSSSSKISWLCRCDCGTQRYVRGGNLNSGKSTGCGCVGKERAKRLNYKHGMSNTPEFKIWLLMLNRCYNPRDNRYLQYGGRGIVVCSEWRHDFMRFYKDMGPRPDGKSIDRRDVNGSYTPENCRWATDREQAGNKRNNHYLTYQGRTMIHADWARELGIDTGHLSYYLKHRSLELAVKRFAHA